MPAPKRLFDKRNLSQKSQYGKVEAIVSNNSSTTLVAQMGPRDVRSSGLMLSCAERFFGDEVAATAIEYGLIAALVSIAAVGALTAMGISLVSLFDFVSVQIDLDPHQCRQVGSSCTN